MALGKKTGGRQKGTPNKRTAANMALVAQATSEGISPLEVMLKAMRDARPGTDRQYLQIASQHMRWRLKDVA